MAYICRRILINESELRGISSVGLEHLPYKQGVTGSNPVFPTKKIKLHRNVRLFFMLFFTCRRIRINSSSKYSNDVKIMKKTTLAILMIISSTALFSQTNPTILNWLQNNSTFGSHYVSGNSTVIQDNVLANVQTVQYSSNWVYISTKGIPSYPTGPFLDGNPSLASDQSAIFKFPLNPTENTGTKTPTNPGNIGVFVNGVALFDYRDGVAWNATTSALCGGPGNPACPGGPTATQVWNRDAVPAEMAGFDCSKGHPAMGNYHHHQNPSAFKLDQVVLSTICNLYDADGLYTINASQHSPLIGFAYDGFPIYGAYGYANANGTGGITRMKSGYELANYAVRTNYPDGTDVVDGPAVNSTYFLGYFREDYQWVAHAGQEDYLDIHNGRFCVTPEYPGGTYAYFCTVDDNWNSAYPYAVGPTFYGNVTGAKVTTISETVETYTSTNGLSSLFENESNFSIYPNPSNEFVAVQVNDIVKNNLDIELYDATGKVVRSAQIAQGSTIWYLDVRTLYSGQYQLKITDGQSFIMKKVIIGK